MTLVNVEGFSNLKKDSASGGVVNVDAKSYKSYKASKALALQKYEEQIHTQHNVTMLQEEINTMKSDLNDIKSILLQILEKGK
jgi:hypothetical protein